MVVEQLCHRLVYYVPYVHVTCMLTTSVYMHVCVNMHVTLLQTL